MDNVEPSPGAVRIQDQDIVTRRIGRDHDQSGETGMKRVVLSHFMLQPLKEARSTFSPVADQVDSSGI